jgi:hypothetical protein
LIIFLLISLALAATVDILRRRAQHYGGLALSTSADNFSGVANASYLFLPSIVAIIYGLAFGWIDLDAKRMQPWIALSRRGGAMVEDSLLLDYPFEFTVAVPFKAARRRSVVCTLLLMLY